MCHGTESVLLSRGHVPCPFILRLVWYQLLNIVMCHWTESVLLSRGHVPCLSILRLVWFQLLNWINSVAFPYLICTVIESKNFPDLGHFLNSKQQRRNRHRVIGNKRTSTSTKRCHAPPTAPPFFCYFPRAKRCVFDHCPSPLPLLCKFKLNFVVYPSPVGSKAWKVIMHSKQGPCCSPSSTPVIIFSIY